MHDKLKAISPILIVALFLSQCYLVWAVSDARSQSRSANFQATQAINAANRAYTSAANAESRIQQMNAQLLSSSSSAGSDSLMRQFYSQQMYSTIYHEFLLEDLARSSKLDLGTIRVDFERLAREMGYARPQGWSWAREAE